jgi:hypothetical protein
VKTSQGLYCNIAEGAVVFQCSLHVCQQSYSTTEQEHVFQPHKSCPIASDRWHSAVPCHCHSGILTVFIQKIMNFFYVDDVFGWIQFKNNGQLLTFLTNL